jgi:glutaredoxin
MLDDMGVSYKNIDIEKEGLSRDDLAKITGGHTVPQIIINEKSIGGFNELLQLNQSGKLKELLGNS